MAEAGRADTFIALPTYDGRVSIPTMFGVLWAGDHATMPCHAASSLLPKSFNMLWANAVASGLPYFAMMHADIGPPEGWLDTLIDEMNNHCADIVSTVVAIKDDSGTTSTAVDEEGGFRRLHIQELDRLPATFETADIKRCLGLEGNLLVNTGLFVADLRKSWAKQVWFEINSGIRWADGEVQIDTDPEDWNLSRQLHALSCKVMATQRIDVIHMGGRAYGTKAPQGTS